MNQPPQLYRYEKIRAVVLRPDRDKHVSEIVGDEQGRWEVLGFAVMPSAAGTYEPVPVVLIGKVDRIEGEAIGTRWEPGKDL